MTYNKSEIMRQAWAWFKNDSSYKAGWYRSPEAKRMLFAQKLKSAWELAKYEAKPVAETDKHKEIRQRIFILECKDRWTDADHSYYDQLREELQAAA